MRIVHVTHRAWPAVGGAERYVLEVAARQAQDGHQATLIATDANELSALWDPRRRRFGPDTPCEHRGVSIRRLPLRYLPLSSTSVPSLRRVTWLLSAISERAALPLARLFPRVPALPPALTEERGDLLFAWNITFEGISAAVASDARMRRVPWVAVPLLHLGRPRFYTMSHQLALLRDASLVLTQTGVERDFLLGRGLRLERVHVVSPGVDLREASQADGGRFRAKYSLEGPLVLFLGPPSREKGVPHLVSAMRHLWGRGLRATLVLLGPGTADEWGRCAGLGRIRGFPVRMLGQVPETDKWDAIDAAAIVAMPSRTESFGVVYLEAWARRKPVIGAREGAVPDVISDGTDGLLTDFGDVPQLAAAVRRLLIDSSLAVAMGEHGYQTVVRHYQWDYQYGRLRDILGEALVVRGRDASAPTGQDEPHG
jgi:glycosyltransferase involved in cell wall biosynthesis